MLPALGKRLLPFALILGLAAWIQSAVISGQILVTRDLGLFFIPDASVSARSFAEHQLPLWNPYLRAGQPLLATLQSQVLYPPRMLALLVASPERALSLQLFFELAISGLLAFGLARALGLRRWGATVAALTWAGGGTLAALGAQLNVASAAAWAPAALWAAARLGRAPTGRRVALLAAVLALDFLAGSPETFVWVATLTVLTAVSVARGRARAGLSALGAAALGLALAGVELFPALELVGESTRAHGLATASGLWSFRLQDLAELALPFLRSTAMEGASYWSEQHFIVAIFAGSSACLLAVFGLRRLARRWGAGLVGAVLLLAVSLGALPANPLARYPAKFFPAVLLAIALAAGRGLDRLAASGRRGRTIPSVLLVVPLLFISAGWLAGGLFGLSLGWAGVATGLTLAAFTLVPGRAASLACLILLGELVAYHSLAPVAAIAPAHSRKPSQLEALVPALTRASVARGDAEVAQFAAGKFEDDTGTRTFDPAGRRYVIEARGDWAGNNAEEDGVSIAEGYGDPAPWRVSALLAKRTAAIDRLLGISLYVRRVGPPRDDLTHIASPRDTVALFGGSRPMPRAFLVDDGPRVQVLSDQAALARVADQAFDPEADLVVDHQVPLAGATARAEASLATVGSHQPERVEIDAVAARPATLVLTDAAFPGWAVEVDGAPAEGQIADFAFRAVHLQPGPHHIVWRYRPSTLRLGLWSSALAALVLAGLCWRKSGFVSSGR